MIVHDGLSDADVVEMLKVNFHLLAETMAELASRDADKSIVKLHATHGGFKIGCALQALPQTPHAGETE